MSTDGTKPPTIAPRKPLPSGSSGPRPASTETRPVTGPLSGDAAPSATMSGESGESEDTSGGMSSVAARIKKAAQGAVDATRSALPTRADEDAVRGDVSQASTRSSGTSPRTKPAGSAAPSSSGPRRVRLAVARIDPWSVMKLSFLLSVAVGIMIVVATSVIWYTLDSMAVFTSVNDTIAVIANDPAFFNLLDYVAFDRVISLATMIAVVDIVLLTALATIGAFLYNIVAALVGGVHLTMTDD